MLKKSLNRFEEAEKELKDILKHEAAGNIERMDANTLNAIQSVFKFMDATDELIRQQTLTIDDMNRKIDKILSKVSKDTAR